MDLFQRTYHRVFSNLKKGLPAHLTYHDPGHTRRVLEKTIFLAGREKVTGHDLLLLKLAALYHDTGFLLNHKDHEAESCRIANTELNEIGLDKSDINTICGMILATKIPQKPKTALERIIADADLEYLGTRKFEEISELLYHEMKYFRPEMTMRQWYDIQIAFISKHNYHTAWCRKYREPRKQENLAKLMSWQG
jgi:uncharacterized protein